MNCEDETFRLGSLIDPILIGEEKPTKEDQPAEAKKNENYKLGYMEVWGIGKENDILST